MDQKVITRIAVIRAIESLFDGITDDDHALFVFEVMAEFPDDQRVSAIDVNGAQAKWLYKSYPLHMFREALNNRVTMNARDAELNLLVNQL